MPKITIGQLKDELEAARFSPSGSLAEANDLELLIEHARLPGTNKDCNQAWLDKVAAAGNRQAQRRYQRKHTRQTDTTAARTSKGPKVGDYVRDPSGEVWAVTRIGPGIAWHDVPGEPVINCAFSMCTVVDGPLASTVAPVRVATHVATPSPAGETLYHAVWDVLEAEEVNAPARAALETALRAYEVALG